MPDQAKLAPSASLLIGHLLRQPIDSNHHIHHHRRPVVDVVNDDYDDVDVAHQGGWVRRLIGHLLLRPPSFFQTTNISSLFSLKDAEVMHFFSKQRLNTDSAMKKGHTVFPDILFAHNNIEICFT